MPKRSEEATTIAAVAKALAGNHPPEVERELIRIAARAIERADKPKPTPEWAANSKKIHAWVPWTGMRRGRHGTWGYKTLCGLRTTYDFGWSLRVTEPGALAACKRFNFPTPVCAECQEKVATHQPTEWGSEGE